MGAPPAQDRWRSFCIKEVISVTKRLKSQLGLLGGLVLVLLICHFSSGGRLLTPNNLRTILSSAVFPIFTAWGLCFIFSSGLIDLSIGANILLSANVGAYLAIQLGFGYMGLILGSVICSILCVQFSTHCSITLKIPSWISGLGVALILEAILAQWANVLATEFAEKLPTMKLYRDLGKMPGMFYLLIGGLLVSWFIFNKTNLGINLQAVGGNAQIAQTKGINLRKTMIGATLVGGVFIGLASIVNISFSGKLDCASGLNSLNVIFKALAATLLADSIYTIFSKPIGILLSGFFVTALFNILTLFKIPSGTWQNVCLGLMVILCGVLSHLRHKGVVK